MKDLLVPFGGAEGIAALSATVRLAEAFDSRVRGFMSLPDPAMAIAWVGPTFAGTMDGQTIDKVRTAQKAVQNEAETAFKEATGKLKATANFEYLTGMADIELSDRATLSDLTIFAHEDARGETQLSGAFDRVLMDAARPVLIAPPVESDWLAKPIAIAWDGGPEVARAVQAAWPIIEHKGVVTLVQSEKNIENEHAFAADMQTATNWFERRGIRVDVKMIEGHPGDVLLETVENLGAGLMIAGAYGHNRTREFLFGGMTRKLLKAETSFAVLLCH